MNYQTQLPKLLIFLLFPVFSFAQVTISSINPVCNNDGVLVATTASAGPGISYTYYWNTNEGTVSHISSNLTDTLFNFKGGNAYVYVLPNNGGVGGSASGTYPYPFNIISTISPDTCPLQTGAISLAVTGGIAPINYSWTFNGIPFGGNTPALNNLTGGGYDCLIIDAAGCQMFLSDMTSDSLAQTGGNVPSVNNITTMFSSTPANCLNGTATVVPSGGTAPYSYLWSNNQTTATATGLIANNYVTVKVTDANGCFKMAGGSITTTVIITVNSSVTPAHCSFNDGAILVIPTGGTGPYTYLWNTFDVTSGITNIPSGFFNVTVTDAMGCVKQNYFSVNSLTPVNVNYSTTPSQCLGATGTATAVATGGIPPYAYEWYTTPLQTTATASALPSGSYNFKITDTQGCSATGTVTIPQNTNLSLNINTTASVCTQNNGTATMTVAGGNMPYTYLWSNGSTTSVATNLPASVVFGTVTDAIGCSVTECKHVYYQSPLNFTLIPQPASCIFIADAAITVNVINGTPPYTYQWSNGQTTPTLTGILTGLYWLTLTDGNGCTHFDEIFVDYNSVNPCTSTLYGKVFIDMNNDCILTGGDPVMENIPVHCITTGRIDFTDVTGEYSFLVPAGNIEIEQLNVPYRYQVCPGVNPFTINVPSTGISVVQDIADTVDWVNDLSVGFWNLTYPVVGTSFVQRMVEFNQGTQTLLSTNQYDYESQTPYSNSTIVPTTFNPGISQTTWDNAPALPLHWRTYDITHFIPTSVPINTQIVYTDTIFPVSGDTTWWDNSDMRFLNTVGSYDPNYKEVTPIGIGPSGLISPADSILEYVVHFQNIGNYFASNITIYDQLDNDLDKTTLRVVYATHNVQTSISATGELEFYFQNIYLPSIEDDSIGSNGFVVFTIHLKPNLPDGTTIENSAAIYFDFNPPIVTNTTLNTIQITGINEMAEQNTIRVSPNPNNGTFSILFDETISGSVKITLQNVAGQTMLQTQQNIQDGKRIDMSVDQFPKGVYILSVSTDKFTFVEKVVSGR